MSRALFSSTIFSQIRSMLAQGTAPAEIARKIGCTLGTLRVKCSLSGISLRRWTFSTVARKENIPKRLVFSLSDKIAVRFRQKADESGMTTTEFAAALLEAIVRDNLYDAVIDGDVEDEKNSSSRLTRRGLKRP
jgi:hypothetical protein